MPRNQFHAETGIPVADLLLDTLNPRIRHGADQNDCIARLLRDRANFINLCKDIAAKGLMPEHILISRNAEQKWVVRDGNRRVAALKLLNTPALVQSDAALFNTLNRAIETATIPIPAHVDCLACDDETAILDYLERKHTGENQGVGQRDWSALLKSLFSLQTQNRDEYKRAAQLLLWVEERGLSVHDDFYISTLQRGLNTDTLKLIGFAIQDDELTVTLPEHQAYALAARVVQAVANEEVNVKRGDEPGSIFTPEAQLAFFTAVRNELGPPIISPCLAPQNTQADAIVSAPGEHSSSQSNSAPPPGNLAPPPTGTPPTPAGPLGAPASQRRPYTPNMAPRDRKYLFGTTQRTSPGITIPAGEQKVQTIIAELRKLSSSETPLATAMLLRALLELSNEHYRAKHTLRSVTHLHQSIANTADHMKEAGKLTEQQYLVVMSYTRSNESMFHIKTIQAYVHRTTHHPNGAALNTMWDEIGCFIQACWR